MPNDTGLRVLTFTASQLEEMLLAAYYSSVPINLKVARTALQMQIAEEWHKQQREAANV